MKTTKELIIADITAKVEAKLASQKVNLSLIDDYIKQTKSTQKAYDDFNKSYNSFMGFRKQAEAYIENLIPQIQKLEQINLEALNKSKELGINWRDTKEYKQAEDILIRLDVKYLERMKTKLETFQTA
jgi:hypothetical protein